MSASNYRRIAKLYRQIADEFDKLATGPPPPKQNVELDFAGEVDIRWQAPNRRAGFYGGVVRFGAEYRMFTLSEENSGIRILQEYKAFNPLGPFQFVRDHGDGIEFVTLETENGRYRSFDIKRGPSGFNHAVRTTGAFTTFKRFVGNSKVPAPFEVGDVLAVKGDNVIFKGDDWSNNDYHRRWFFGNKELSGVFDAGNGLNIIRKETYGFSIIDPSLYALRSKWEAVALQWIFEITGFGVTNQIQYGVIYPVWAVSDDLVSWQQPFGYQPAIPLEDFDTGMITPFCNPFLVDYRGEPTLMVYFGGTNFEHNRFQTTPNARTRTGLATITKARFESLFA